MSNYNVSTVGYTTIGYQSNEPDATATNRGFLIRTRNVSLNFPVPVLRPTAATKTIAFDLMPSGAPAEFTNNGFTWIDCCSADILDDAAGSVACNTARMGMRNGYAEFGSRLFNGATAVPFKLTVETAALTFKTVAKGSAEGSFVIGDAAIATNAIAGFLYLPSCAGTPTGVPTTNTGTVASVYDTTNNKLYIYNGAWKSITLA